MSTEIQYRTSSEMEQSAGSKLTAKYSQTKTEHQCVSKIKACLEEAGHLGLDMIVIYGIEEYVKSS